MRNKSHSFLRFAIALNKEREKRCVFCPEKIETTNHILYECERLRKYAKKLMLKLNEIFQSGLIFSDKFLLILENDIRINIFQIINLRLIWNYRCKKLKEKIDFEEKKWENEIQNEIERYISKEIFKSEKLFEENRKIWENIIQEANYSNKEINFKKIFL